MSTGSEEEEMNTEITDRLLYKIPQVAEVTGYSRSFIYEAIAKGALKVVRKGRTIRVAADDLRTWIEQQDY